MNNCKKSLDVITGPKRLFADLAESKDLGVAVATLVITSLLFSITTYMSLVNEIPMSTAPLFGMENYRFIQLFLLPLILGAGWILCSFVALVLNFILRGRSGIQRIMAVCSPALFIPMWLMLWPTEFAVSLGVLDPQAAGFPGLWVRHLMPASTLLYTLAMVWLAFWQSFRLLLREAFALAVLSIVPTFGFFSLVLR